MSISSSTSPRHSITLLSWLQRFQKGAEYVQHRLHLKLSQGLYGIRKYLESVDLNANVLLVNLSDWSWAVWPKQKEVPCQCAWPAFTSKYMENSSPRFLSWSFYLISLLVFPPTFLWSKIHDTASYPLSMYHWKPPLCGVCDASTWTKPRKLGLRTSWEEQCWWEMVAVKC